MIMLRSLAFAAAAVAWAAGTAQAQVRWTLPSAYPADNFHSENLSSFAKDLADVTGGKLTINVYPNASLFPATAIKSAVRIGQAQVGEILISLHDNEEPVFGLDVVPFLAASYPDARKLWAASRPAIERKLAAQGLMVLFAVPWPPWFVAARSPGQLRGGDVWGSFFVFELLATGSGCEGCLCSEFRLGEWLSSRTLARMNATAPHRTSPSCRLRIRLRPTRTFRVRRQHAF